jgi:hypothetical protein
MKSDFNGEGIFTPDFFLVQHISVEQCKQGTKLHDQRFQGFHSQSQTT